MSPLLAALALVAFLVSRPLEARLWRAGRLSDRATAVLLLSRMPAMTLVFALLGGLPPLLTVLLVAAASLGPVVFYGFTVRLLAEQRVEREREASRTAKL